VWFGEVYKHKNTPIWSQKKFKIRMKNKILQTDNTSNLLYCPRYSTPATALFYENDTHSNSPEMSCTQLSEVGLSIIHISFYYYQMLNVTIIVVKLLYDYARLLSIWFSLCHSVQTGSGAHPASYPMGTRGSYHGSKVAGV